MSTSSNECECDHFPYIAWANEMKSAWYQSFGQPYVYYSQIQPFRGWQRSEKEKPNYFKKAFRWYTQEHKPFINTRDSSSNMNNAQLKGFAAWLDEKYDEFLQASQVERSKHVLNQTSAETDPTKCEQCEQPASTKYKRVKSPWKKRRNYFSAKEKGDIIMKSKKSIEIILKPKDISYPESECYERYHHHHHISRWTSTAGHRPFVGTSKHNDPEPPASSERTKAGPFCNRSAITVQSNASTPRQITKPKSQSLTDVVNENDIYLIPFDIPDYNAKNAEFRPIKSTSRTKNSYKGNSKKYRPRDISCQCSKYAHQNIDAYTQYTAYEDGAKEPNPCTCKVNTEEIKELFTSEILSNKQPKPNHVLHKEETYGTRRSTCTEKNRTAFSKLVNTDAQTSDHPIDLNQNLQNDLEYPLFVKIVRALKEN